MLIVFLSFVVSQKLFTLIYICNCNCKIKDKRKIRTQVQKFKGTTKRGIYDLNLRICVTALSSIGRFKRQGSELNCAARHLVLVFNHLNFLYICYLIC